MNRRVMWAPGIDLIADGPKPLRLEAGPETTREHRALAAAVAETVLAVRTDGWVQQGEAWRADLKGAVQ